jgi:hypothetical protein
MINLIEHGNKDIYQNDVCRAPEPYGHGLNTDTIIIDVCTLSMYLQSQIVRQRNLR